MPDETISPATLALQRMQENAVRRPLSVADMAIARTPSPTDAVASGAWALGMEDDPGRATRVLQAQARTGLPVAFLREGDHLDRVEQAAATKDFDPAAFRERNPTVYSWMIQNPEYASIIRRDISHLGLLDRVTQGIGFGAERGALTVELAEIGERAFLGTATEADRQRARDIEFRTQTLPDTGLDRGGFGGFLAGIPESAAEQGPIFLNQLGAKLSTALAFAAGGFLVGAGKGAGTALVAGQMGPQAGTPEEAVTVPVAALATGLAYAGKAAFLGWRVGGAVEAARMEGGLAFLEFEGLKDANGVPLDRDAAQVAALAVGVVNGALEMVAFEKLAKTIPGLRGLGRKGVKDLLQNPATSAILRRWAKDVAVAMATEGATEFLQEMVTQSAGKLATMAQDGRLTELSSLEILGELFNAETLERGLEAGRKGAQGGGGLAVVTGGASAGIDAKRRRDRIKQAERFGQALEQAGDAAAQAQMIRDLPEGFRDLATKMAARGKVEDLYAPVESWDRYWQSQDIDPAEAAEALTGDREAYSEAKRTGGDIKVKTADYLTKLAPTEHARFFAQELRADPEALNAREAQELAARYDAADAERLTRLLQEDQVELDSEAQTQQIQAEIATQLEAAGTATNAAAAQAEQFARGVRTLALRAGLSPREVFDRFDVVVRRELPEALQKQSFDAVLASAIDRVKRGAIPTEEQVRGQSLMAFLRETGIRQEEVSRLGNLDDDRRPFQRALFREGGLGLSEAAERAAESGFLERFDEGDLVRALEEERAGSPRFSPANENPQLAELRNSLLALEGDIRDAGIDLESMTADEVVQQLAALDQGRERSAAARSLEQSGDKVATSDQLADLLAEAGMDRKEARARHVVVPGSAIASLGNPDAVAVRDPVTGLTLVRQGAPAAIAQRLASSVATERTAGTVAVETDGGTVDMDARAAGNVVRNRLQALAQLLDCIHG